MFNPSNPIQFCKEDELSRCQFAKSLGDSILSYNNEESLVIGLLGKWGYGKTSIINMALEHIVECTEGDDSPIIIEFNPWHFSNQNQLIKKFFDELSIKLADEDIKNSINSYVNKLIPPIIGLASIIDPARTQALLKNTEFFDDPQSTEESLESLKNSLCDLIAKKNQKIIIVIDDIDRLSDLEIQQIFQLVKLLADFPNTIYLLSFDRDAVITALKNIQKVSGEKYLEKIVQIPFEVPILSKEDKERLLIDNINKINDIFEIEVDEFYLSNIYFSGFNSLFKNLRDINRVINVFKFGLGILKNETNFADFLALTAIQVLFPEIYVDIRDNKELFTELYDSTIPDEKKIGDKEIYEGILEKSQDYKNYLDELFKQMFPKIETIYKNMTYSPDFSSEWRRNRRICSSENFETYFKFSIPKGEISQSEFEEILASCERVDSFSSEIQILIDNEKILKFIERFWDYIDILPEEHILNIIEVLMDMADLFPPMKSGFMGIIDTPMRVLQIINKLIRRFETCDERFEILKKAIEDSEKSLFVPVKKVSIEDQRQGKYGLKDEPSPVENWTVDSDQLDILENIACSKIENWANDGRLAKHSNLSEILFIWKRWDETNTLNFVQEIIKDDEGLVDFITSFMRKGYSHIVGDKVSKSILQMNLENINEFASLDEIVPRIRNIKSSNDFETLSNNKKKAINVFLHNFDNPNSDD